MASGVRPGVPGSSPSGPAPGPVGGSGPSGSSAQGAILYSMVSRGPVVLAEYAVTTGNFPSISKKILEKLPQQDNKLSYVYDRHIFHIIVDDGMVYLCMADEDFGRRIPFQYLEDIKNRWRAAYSDRGRSAAPYAMNEDFSGTLRKQMEYYSSDAKADKLRKVQGEIEEVKSVMTQNIEKVLARGEKIELLVDKTDALNQTALKFKRQSSQLKRAMWFKNVKLMLALFFVAAAIIYFIVASACGGLTLPKC